MWTAPTCNCNACQGCLQWPYQSKHGPTRSVETPSFGFAGIIGTVAEDRHLTHGAHVCFAGTEKDHTETPDRGTLGDILGERDTDWFMDPTVAADEDAELLESEENVQLHGFAFLFVLALLFDDNIATCDIWREKHESRCFVLLGLQGSQFLLKNTCDVGVATTRRPTPKRTKCRRHDGTRPTAK